jgi:hypothetical protein
VLKKGSSRWRTVLGNIPEFYALSIYTIYTYLSLVIKQKLFSMLSSDRFVEGSRIVPIKGKVRGIFGMWENGVLYREEDLEIDGKRVLQFFQSLIVRIAGVRAML